MPAKSKKPAKKSSVSSKKQSFWSKLSPKTPLQKLVVFALVVGVVAGGYYTYRSFAYWGPPLGAFRNNTTFQSEHHLAGLGSTGKFGSGKYGTYHYLYSAGATAGLKDNALFQKYRRAIGTSTGTAQVCFKVAYQGGGSPKADFKLSNGVTAVNQTISGRNDQPEWKCFSKNVYACPAQGPAVINRGSTGIRVYAIEVRRPGTTNQSRC